MSELDNARKRQVEREEAARQKTLLDELNHPKDLTAAKNILLISNQKFWHEHVPVRLLNTLEEASKEIELVERSNLKGHKLQQVICYHYPHPLFPFYRNVNPEGTINDSEDKTVEAYRKGKLSSVLVPEEVTIKYLTGRIDTNKVNLEDGDLWYYSYDFHVLVDKGTFRFDISYHTSDNIYRKSDGDLDRFGETMVKFIQSRRYIHETYYTTDSHWAMDDGDL